jgi:membrane-associated phospholipid phosphatase
MYATIVSTLIYIFHLIAFIGPIILLTITTLLLWKKEVLLFYFILGAILNIALNFLLKDLFKEPRPSGNEQIIQIAINNGKRLGSQVYGMPSGHAQTAFYCTVFIFLSLKNWKIVAFYLAMALFTCYQRYIYKEHTLWQLFVGALVGSVMATISLNTSKKKKIGLLIPKPEDGAPY